MNEPDRDRRGKAFAQAAEVSAKRFLDGHLTPEEERHALNIGRVCLEFACLEEAIGELAVALNGMGRDSETYMERVKNGHGVASAIREIVKAEADLGGLRKEYDSFKLDRDRYAHSSIGTIVRQDEAVDGQRGVLHFVTGQQKHPKGDGHPRGRVSSLPTTEESDALIRSMRALRMKLLMRRTKVTVTRATRVVLPNFHELTHRATRSVLDGLSAAIRRAGR